MSNYFDKGLHYLGASRKDCLVLNIGAMDGVLFDEMIGYTRMYNFKGLYVEPIPYLFEKLKNNVGGDNFFENCAISDYNGTISMITIDQQVIDNGQVHNCFYGMSAVYPPKNGLGSEFDRPTVEKYGRRVEVQCKTLNTVLDTHNIKNFNVIKVDAEGHDYIIFKQLDFTRFSPEIIRLEWINLSDDEKISIKETLNNYNYKYEISGQDIVALRDDFYIEVFEPTNLINSKKQVTLVTGLWDIKRDSLSLGWNRNFQHYLDKFNQLLDVEYNLIIFGDSDLEEFVFKKRSRLNTQFIRRDVDWFKTNSYFDLIQNIRQSPDWYNQVGWLSESTQAKLELYNPLVMSKMFLLHDAKILDQFDSEYLFWIDAGLTNTVHPGYFTHDKVIDKLHNFVNSFHFICFPYETSSEIHGFKYQDMLKYCNSEKVDKVARGGFFGGKKTVISEVNNLYYSLLIESLSAGLMGTEESLFTILVYQHPELFTYSTIEGNGLINRFFEDLKNDNIDVSREKLQNGQIILKDNVRVGLYIMTFNSPNQLQTLLDSMEQYDKNFILKPEIILLDNSTDISTLPAYQKICEKYRITHIKKDNLGICGGRQFIAEHAEEKEFDFYFFFEDDMFFYPHKGEVCKNGFNRWVDNLYDKSVDIMLKDSFDFLKLSFTEFFGDNRTQWSWYNVPQFIREQYWPEKSKLPTQGLDPNAPKTKFSNIYSSENLAYADGEIYYCNWPQIVSKVGNQKMFLETKWTHPYEQTWMSHIFQETKKDKIKPAILLLSPTEHNRFDHYSRELRKES